MQNLAKKMANDYHEQLFWLSMEIIAGEILGFPKVKIKDIICPKCNSENIRYDIHESRFHCGECSLAWDDKLYVLVEFPEDSAPFEEEGTGYPAWESGDNGALYVPEEGLYPPYRQISRAGEVLPGRMLAGLPEIHGDEGL